MANPSPSNSAASEKQADQLSKQISQDIPMPVALEKNKRLQDALESGDVAGVIALFSPMNKWIIDLRLWNSTQKVSYSGGLHIILPILAACMHAILQFHVCLW